MHLIECKRVKNLPVPASLPPSLIQSLRGGAPAGGAMGGMGLMGVSAMGLFGGPTQAELLAKQQRVSDFSLFYEVPLSLFLQFQFSVFLLYCS